MLLHVRRQLFLRERELAITLLPTSTALWDLFVVVHPTLAPELALVIRSRVAQAPSPPPRRRRCHYLPPTTLTQPDNTHNRAHSAQKSQRARTHRRSPSARTHRRSPSAHSPSTSARYCSSPMPTVLSVSRTRTTPVKDPSDSKFHRDFPCSTSSAQSPCKVIGTASKSTAQQ